MASNALDSGRDSLSEKCNILRFRTEPQSISKPNCIRTNFMYTSTENGKCDLQLYCFKYNSSQDSILVYAYHVNSLKLKSGSNSLALDIRSDDTNAHINPSFKQVLFNQNYYPVGNYRLYTLIKPLDLAKTQTAVYSFNQDSSLSQNSKLYRRLTGQSKLYKRLNYSGSKSKVRVVDFQINRYAKAHQLEVVKSSAIKGIKYSVYSKGILLGSIATDDKGVLTRNRVAANIKEQLTLMTEFKESEQSETESKGIEGIISSSTSLNTNQDPFANTDNNYWELKGSVTVPIATLPIQLEGYYTTQDRSRTIKSSYFKVHYDVTTLKQDLIKKVDKYKQKYQQSCSKTIGMNGLYQKTLNGLEHQSALLKDQINSEETRIAEQASTKLDSSEQELKSHAPKPSLKSSEVDSLKSEVVEKRRKLEELNAKIEKYNKLLDQNKDCQYFDSALAYKKLSGQQSLDDISYKRLLKQSTELFPDGKFKKAVCGITEFDAGVFSKYQSKFTMPGQNMKGFGMGYEMGIYTLNCTVGKTQFIGRDGGMEHFTTYATQLKLNAKSNNELSLHYYAYTADLAVRTSSNFINNMELQRPTLNEPQQIISITDQYKPTEWLSINGEVASSSKNITKMDIGKLQNSSAVDLSADLFVPNSTYKAEIHFESTGQDFENKTMPINLKGSQRISVANSIDVLKSFLSVGVNFNYLAQQQFNQLGRNIKYGVDIATHSHQYPNLSFSYKPYSTFRSFSDTFLTSQRPLFGSVLSTSIKYQFKKERNRWLFSINWNQCKTVADSQMIQNTVVQGMVNYSKNSLSTILIVGLNEQHGLNENLAAGNMRFAQLLFNYKLGKGTRISLGQEVGWTFFGFSKFGTSISGSYQSRRAPIVAVLSLRSNYFKVQESETGKRLFGANADVTYIIKRKTERG